MNSRFLSVILIALVLVSGACAPATSAVPAVSSNPNLILATTTSTQDSGLLDMLVPLFEEESGFTVQTVAVGSGQAMKMGEEGNADVLLVHAPATEVTFMENGFGKDRALVMHNDFIIVGPASDPAGIQGMAAAEALHELLTKGMLFASRGDDSGTHKAELALWKKAGFDPKTSIPAWYVETGQGMGATLTIASEKEAYTLTDRASYLANKGNLQLDILVEDDASLLNVYHVITVNPGKWDKVNYEGAMAFMKFMIQASTQERIGQFGMETYGQPLFYPDAHKTYADLGL